MVLKLFPNPLFVHRFALHRHGIGDMTGDCFQMQATALGYG